MREKLYPYPEAPYREVGAVHSRDGEACEVACGRRHSSVQAVFGDVESGCSSIKSYFGGVEVVQSALVAEASGGDCINFGAKFRVRNWIPHTG